MTIVAPRLSVIVASTSGRASGLRDTVASLAAVARQFHGVEMILAYRFDRSTLESIAPTGVTLVPLPLEATLPQLLGTAIARATGEILAITDWGCGVEPGWVAAILKAHESDHPVIGGAVEPDGLRTLVDWAAYFCDYGQFMLPLAGGVVREVPGSNLSLKRRALARGTRFVEPEFWKSYWCRQLQAEGVSLHSAPSIVASYRKSFRLWPYLVRRFHHGRCFAGMRGERLTRVKRALYGAGTPVLPLLFCARLLRAVPPKRRHLGLFCLSFPLILLAMVTWACGELWGYLLGPGASCRHVT